MTDPINRDANLDWLLSNFVSGTMGVVHSLVVSSDGLPIAMSSGVPRDIGDRFSAITASLTSLTVGAAECFDFDSMRQVIVEMRRGFLFVMAISDGSSLAVVCERNCDIGLIGYEMTLLCERCGDVLTPELISQLQRTLPQT